MFKFEKITMVGLMSLVCVHTLTFANDASKTIENHAETLLESIVDSSTLMKNLSKRHERVNQFKNQHSSVSLIGTSASNNLLKDNDQGDLKSTSENSQYFQRGRNNTQLAYRNNPFAVTSQLQRQGISTTSETGDFVRSDSKSDVPKIKLKGILNQKKTISKEGRELGNMAMLEVDKEVYMVRAGETVSVFVGNKNTVFRVIDVARNSVSIELGSLGRDGQILLVR